MRRHIAAIGMAALFLAAPAQADLATPSIHNILMPMNCSELLPDNEPFLGYFEAVAKGLVRDDRAFSLRLFRVLSLYSKVDSMGEYASENNPVGILIRKTLCFYRQQQKPTAMISFDDPKFRAFLKQGLPELEGKVEDVVFQLEYRKAQKAALEKQLLGNSAVIRSIRRQAEEQAERSYRNLTEKAQRKARTQ